MTSESPFEAAQRFEVGLALVALAPVVVLARAGHSGLGDGRDVQHVVEPAVAAAVEPVPVVVPGGHVDGRGAGVAGEVRLGRDRRTSITSARVLPAPSGPMPSMLISELPWAATASAICALRSFSLASSRSRSPT